MLISKDNLNVMENEDLKIVDSYYVAKTKGLFEFLKNLNRLRVSADDDAPIVALQILQKSYMEGGHAFV